MQQVISIVQSNKGAIVVPAIKSDITKKVVLFIGILASLALAVNI